MSPNVEPRELVQAVALLLQEKTAAVADVQRERDANLRELYRMITAVVHGDGMLDTLAEDNQGEALEGTEGWELFKSEASLQGEGGGLKIALPDLAAIEVSSNAMEVDAEEEMQGQRQAEEDEVESKVLQDSITPPAPVITPFVVPTVPASAAATRQVYIPRSLRPDAADAGTATGTTTAAPRWLNGRLNSAAYEPAMDPRIWPVAASGRATELGFGKEGKQEQEVTMTDGALVRGDPFEMLIPLEDPYAANLHPLPPVNQPLKHKHHHHRRESGKRERTRSAADGTTATATSASTLVPDNPTFGNFSFGVPPAYIQASQKRAKVELIQAQHAAQSKAAGSKAEEGPTEEKPNMSTITTMNPVLANPTDATTALAPPPPLSLATTTPSVPEHEPRGTIINPIPSSTLAPATRALPSPGTGKRTDLVELGVGFKANPLSRIMKKTNKCLTSRDWQVRHSHFPLFRSLIFYYIAPGRRRTKKSSTLVRWNGSSS